MASRSAIIFPTGVSACKNPKYFQSFKDYCGDRNVVSSIILYPHRMLEILSHAQESLNDRASMMPVPVIGCSFTGSEGFKPALKMIFSFLVFTAQVKDLTIVTSGGSSKLVDLANTAGVLAGKIGIRTEYIWAAKGRGDKYEISIRPKLAIKTSTKFDIKINQGGTLDILLPTQ